MELKEMIEVMQHYDNGGEVEFKPINTIEWKSTTYISWNWDIYTYRIKEQANSEVNNGGSTDYYKFKENWKECADIIEDRKMNYNQGNIFKASFCFNIGRHDGTSYERELNKIVYFANRELEGLKWKS